MEPSFGLFWARRLTDLFLEDMLIAKRTPPGLVDVRPQGENILICFHRISDDIHTAEKYRVNEPGTTIWVPGDTFFLCTYHPKDYEGHARDGKDLRERVATMIMAHGFKLKRENVKYRLGSDTDYVSEYVRKI